MDVKNNVLARITEPSNSDYDNDGSENCDHNFGTVDDFGVKNDQKVSHNMILMSKYKGQHGGKKGKKNREGVSPPGNAQKNFFRRASLMDFIFGYVHVSITIIIVINTITIIIMSIKDEQSVELCRAHDRPT